MGRRREYRITAPDTRTRDIVGVAFADGVGFTADPARLAFFERRGWDIEPIEHLTGEPLTPEQEEALAEAREKGIEVPTIGIAAGPDADAAQVALNTLQSEGEQAEREAKAAADAGDADKAAAATKPKASAKAPAKK